MPLPLILAGAAAVSAAGTYALPFLKRYLRKHGPEIEAWAMANALEKIGLPDLTSDTLSKEDFTAAINTRFLAGTDVHLSNIFDSQAIKDDVGKSALKRAATELGIELKNATIEGMKDALAQYVRKQLEEQIGAGAGELVDAAKSLKSELKLIEYAKEAAQKYEAGLDQSPAAVANRARQAKYRSQHTKRWEAR
jgi:hypothetical protein